jgi:hypothetical protein
MLKLTDFFGLLIDEEYSDIIPLMNTLKVTKMINQTQVVKSLIKENGINAAIVSVARRQQLLKMLRVLLDAKMLDYDALYYDKEITTSSDHDRRYGAEDKLLEYGIIVASTRSKRLLDDERGFITVRQLREAAFPGTRFDKLWDILSEETRHIVDAYRKTNSK